jgi:NAD(P)-dependent dehydrogenase (short-subunit alcohol dehydrogenase family)
MPRNRVQCDQRFRKASPHLPLQVGALVRHLCTDDAAAITGACLSIDGGWTAR